MEKNQLSLQCTDLVFPLKMCQFFKKCCIKNKLNVCLIRENVVFECFTTSVLIYKMNRVSFCLPESLDHRAFEEQISFLNQLKSYPFTYYSDLLQVLTILLNFFLKYFVCMFLALLNVMNIIQILGIMVRAKIMGFGTDWA